MKWAQSFLNIAIGVVLLTNFHLLAGLTQIPMAVTIGLCFVISAYYFTRHFNLEKFVGLINNWLFLAFLFFSIFLGIIDFLINKSSQSYNDMIRVFLNSLYFSWTAFMLKDISGLKIWIRRICLSSILILIIEGLFELFQPLIWTFLLSSNVEKRTVGRIAGALIDSNVFACTLIILFLSWLYTSDNRSRGINGAVFLIFGLSILYLVDLSGSRQGLIIILALPFYYYFKNISRSKLIKFGLVLMVCLSFIAIFQEQLTKFSTENPSSSIARMFGNSNDSQNKSNDERLTSILQGITMLQKDFFVLGPGIFNFNSRWASESDTTEPHNAVIYLLVQYGVFSLPLFYLFALSFYRAYKSSINGMVFVYFALFIHLMFQPNSMYYPISFFVVFIVDLGRSDFFNVRPKLVQG